MASDKRQPAEAMPLLVSHQGVSVQMAPDKSTDDKDIDISPSSRHKPSLIIVDTFLVLIKYFQLSAILLSLSLRWPWPESWLQAVSFAFAVNLDVWDFTKLWRAYVSVYIYFTPSATVGFSYHWLMAAWGVFLLIAAIIFIAISIHHKRLRHPHMLMRVARLKRVYIFLVQVLSLPLGVTIGRLFHCTDANVVDVENSLTCFHPVHWAYLLPAVLVAIFFFIIMPLWLILKTRAEMLDMTSQRHEAYLQLKENEYAYDLSIVWAVDNFHIFSSFKKYGAHTRALMLTVDGIVIILYAALFRHADIQAIALCVLFAVVAIISIIVRPFRISAFNITLVMSFICLALNAMMGALQVNLAMPTISMIWLIPYYQTIVLAIINVSWLAIAFVFIMYLFLRCHCCNSTSLWPTLTSGGGGGATNLSPETRKYIKAVLRGRVFIDQVMMMPAIFAPVPELDRQIHIINAFCREADYLHDPIHDALWDLLDELIDTHSTVAPKSLFAASVKDSIRLTTSDLMKMMPVFVRRLAQREYDLILVRPVKRRLLLKLYCLSLFLRHTSRLTKQQRLTFPAIQKIWQPPAIEDNDYEDDGYYEDMYPEPEQTIAFRPTTATINFDLLTQQDLEDDLAIEEADQWTRQHPITPHAAHLNLAYVDDIGSDMDDDDDDDEDLSQMLEKVPPLTANSDSLGEVDDGDKSRPSTGTKH